ncbi:MAG: tRNA epoxyqueuosine(34) reductase QueG [Burkholderiales bacterium]|jgi:epoxyqueuosine reductase|nr:tRNA epoxyqueuosine(34) reductase QueG [Burkholderiales bacterium]
MKSGDRHIDTARLADEVKAWGRELGFQAVGIADADLGDAPARLADWLARGFHGEMDYMARQAALRADPAALHPGTLRVVSVRMDYLPDAADAEAVLANGEKAFVSRYAVGRDYHKVLRARLAKLAKRIEAAIGPFGYRVFTDSAPVMEVEFATKSGIGWRGKHTLALSRDAGSFFFLGEIYTDLDLPVDAPVTEHCGSCTKCIDVCPTQAIVAPYVVDARRCISYLTIELKGAIPVELRPLLGNRIYGCDDCQLICPWNKYAQVTKEPDFRVRNGLDAADLVDLFAWSREDFETRMAGSAIHRIGYERWLRNLAVGLGNAPASERVIGALRSRENDASELVREHVAWALQRLQRKGAKDAKGREGK